MWEGQLEAVAVQERVRLELLEQGGGIHLRDRQRQAKPLEQLVLRKDVIHTQDAQARRDAGREAQPLGKARGQGQLREGAQRIRQLPSVTQALAHGQGGGRRDPPTRLERVGRLLRKRVGGNVDSSIDLGIHVGVHLRGVGTLRHLEAPVPEA